MKNTGRRLARIVAAASSMLAAALLPAGVAFADEWDFTVDPTTFVATQAEGYPPFENVLTGTESVAVNDLTTPGAFDVALHAVDTQTTIGSFTNNDFLYNGDPHFDQGVAVDVPVGTQVDLADFGGGWQNEWIDIPAGGTDPGASDLLITPFGDFALFGSFFSDLSAAL
jgi:hypothetical protein